jgi:hypothetical protein
MQRLNDEYADLLNLFVQLVQSQANKPIIKGDEWQNDAQTLSVKLFYHLKSMQTLATGTTVALDGNSFTVYVDHASIKVLARVALETYLVFFYLYGTSDVELSKFRHVTWRLGGLADRQQFHASTEETKKVQARDRDAAEQLRHEIKAMSHFQSYTPKQQTKLLKGEWRTGNSWADLGTSAGFHKKYFQDIYSYLCGYSHSSYHSVLQVGQAKTIEDQQMLTQSIFGIGNTIMAHFAFSYSDFFKATRSVLEANSDQKRIAESWRFGADDMTAIYNQQRDNTNESVIPG